jgi:hypothetical protein
VTPVESRMASETTRAVFLIPIQEYSNRISSNLRTKRLSSFSLNHLTIKVFLTGICQIVVMQFYFFFIFGYPSMIVFHENSFLLGILSNI